MSLANVGLWLVGVLLIIAAVFRGRGPYRHMLELDRLAENARRYDGWRGGRGHTAAEAGEVTGADLMRRLLRRRVLIWAAVAGLGALLILAGFAIR